MSVSDTLGIFFGGMALPFVLMLWLLVKLVRTDEATARRDYERELKEAGG